MKPCMYRQYENRNETVYGNKDTQQRKGHERGRASESVCRKYTQSILHTFKKMAFCTLV